MDFDHKSQLFYKLTYNETCHPGLEPWYFLTATLYWFYVTSSYTKLVIYGQQQVKADLDDGAARLQAYVAKDDLADLPQDHVAPVTNHPPSSKHLDHLKLKWYIFDSRKLL